MPLESTVVDFNTVLGFTMYTAALCLGAAALKSLREVNIHKDNVVLIFGVAGGIGHLAGMTANKIFGARVVEVDRNDKAEALKIYAAHGISDLFIAPPETFKGSEEFPAEIHRACVYFRGGCSVLAHPDATIMAASPENS